MLVDPGDPSGAGEASLAATAEVALGVSFPFLFIGLRVLGALETDGITCCCAFDVTPASSCPAYHHRVSKKANHRGSERTNREQQA